MEAAMAVIEESGFAALQAIWPQRDGFQSDLDAGRAGREARNPYLRAAAMELEEAIMKLLAGKKVAR
jgi:chromosome partitioning protein